MRHHKEIEYTQPSTNTVDLLLISLTCIVLFFAPWRHMVIISGIVEVTPVEFVGLLLCLSWLVFVLIKYQQIKLSPLHVFLAGLLVYTIVSLAWTVSFSSSISRVPRFAFSFGLAVIVYNIARDKEIVNLLLQMMVMGAGVLCIALIIGFLTQVGEGFRRIVDIGITVDWVNPNRTAHYLILSIPMSLYLYFEQIRKSYKIINSIYFMLAPVGVLLTGSRGGLIILSLTYFLILSYSLKVKIINDDSYGWRFSTLLIPLTISAFIFTYSLPSQTIEYLTTIPAEIATGRFGGRLEIMHASFNVAIDYFPLGAGANTDQPLVESVLPGHIHGAHDAYTRIMIEYGVVGILLWILVYFYSVLHNVRNSGRIHTMWCVVLAIMPVMWLLRSYHVDTYVWVILAISVANIEK